MGSDSDSDLGYITDVSDGGSEVVIDGPIGGSATINLSIVLLVYFIGGNIYVKC